MSLEGGRVVRSIKKQPPIEPTRMFNGKPILEANPKNAWESRVVLNAAAVCLAAGPELESLFVSWKLAPEACQTLRAAGGACVMLYRAQGEKDQAKHLAPSYLGMAIFTPLLKLVVRWPQPVIRPVAAFHNLGVEDARCSKVGDTYYLYYTGYASDDPGDLDVPRRVRICLATTKDFLDWELRGPLTGDLNEIDNKNPGLFPKQVNGKWLLLHRPMAGTDAMTIHLAEADDPAGPWQSTGKLMESFDYSEFKKSWIGAGGPPVATDDGRFVEIYHQGHFLEDGRREYDLAAALIDFRQANPVVSRIEPLMRPSAAAEQVGDPDLGVDNVLFTCASYRWKDDLIIPYAGADSRIFGATVRFDDLLSALEMA